MATAVAKGTQSSKELASFDYGDEGGQGFEHQSSQDYSIPFIAVLQAMSPQVADASDGGVEGAKAGMIFNTVTGEVLPGKDGIDFVPSVTQHVFVEWVPRDSGGGFVAIHAIDSKVVAEARRGGSEFGKLRTPAGNDLIETFYVYGVICEGEDPREMAVIAFTSTKIKVYKRFSTKVNMFTIKTARGKQKPPLFAHSLKITTVKEKNNKGDFFNFAISPANGDLASSLLAPDDPRYQAAKDAYTMIESGTAKASYATQNADGADGGDGDIPF